MGQESKNKASAAKPKPATPPATQKPATASDKQAPQGEIGKQKREPALKGYCPAAYILQGKAVKGNPAYSSTYRGKLYYLSSAEAKKQFDADPEKFLPQFDGLCTTALGGSYGIRKASDPQVFTIYKGKLYLFSSERAKRAFEPNPDWFIARAEAIFVQPALDGYCVVSYQKRNKALKGFPNIKYQYKGKLYRFASPRAKAAFIEEPEKYLPKYDGYCAEGVSRNKRYPADPGMFIVHNGRTYLFFDAQARLKFMVNPAKMAEQADANWAKMKMKDK